jgi:hypothetical protein
MQVASGQCGATPDELRRRLGLLTESGCIDEEIDGNRLDLRILSSAEIDDKSAIPWLDVLLRNFPIKEGEDRQLLLVALELFQPLRSNIARDPAAPFEDRRLKERYQTLGVEALSEISGV